MQVIRVFTVLIFALLTAIPSNAEQDAQDINLDKLQIEPRILKRLRRNPQQFLQQMVQQMFRVSADGIVTADALGLQLDRAQAERRAQFLARVLRFDLDGDFAISAQEIARQINMLPSDDQLTIAGLKATADQNRDGAVQQAEIISYVNAKIGAQDNVGLDPYGIMSFDADGNGKVSFEEIGAVVRKIVETPQFEAIGPAKRQLLERQKALVECGYTQPSPKAEVVLLGTGAGAFQSDVFIGNPERTTGVVRLDVDPGEAPLYIIAFSRDPVIWALEGSVERVERFITDRDIAGVSGLDPAYVSLVAGTECVPRNYSSINASNVLIGVSHLSKAFDHPVLPAIVEKTMGHVHLPSGVEEVTLKYRPPKTDRVMRLGKIQWFTEEGWQPAPQRFLAVQFLYHQHRKAFPGGIARLPAAAVISDPAAAKYEVLPQEAGLMQLILDGLVVAQEDTNFRIDKPIPRLPADMPRVSSIRYILGPDVPDLPPGDPGNAKVLAADGVTCLAGPRCN